jgi:hypothetical protein
VIDTANISVAQNVEWPIGRSAGSNKAPKERTASFKTHQRVAHPDNASLSNVKLAARQKHRRCDIRFLVQVCQDVVDAVSKSF